jgi:hypothetical protein
MLKYVYYLYLKNKIKNYEIVSKKCFISLNVDLNNYSIQYFSKETNYFFYYDFKNKDEKFYNFIDMLLSIIDNCELTIISLDFSLEIYNRDKNNYMIESHKNVLLINKDKNNIYFHHYEPFGSNEPFYYDYVDTFFYHLKNGLEISKKKIHLNTYSGSSKFGIQSQLKGFEIGYCIIMSCFWLYLVLQIYDKFLEKNISANKMKFNTIDDMFDIYFSDGYDENNDFYTKQQLYNILIVYGFNLYHSYISSNTLSDLYKSEILYNQQIIINKFFDDLDNSGIKTKKKYRYERLYN